MTVVESDQKAPFSIATAPRCKEWDVTLFLDCSTLPLKRSLYCWVLSKAVSSTIFKVFGMTRPGIEPRTSGPLANTLPTANCNISCLILLSWNANIENIYILINHIFSYKKRLCNFWGFFSTVNSPFKEINFINFLIGVLFNHLHTLYVYIYNYIYIYICVCVCVCVVILILNVFKGWCINIGTRIWIALFSKLEHYKCHNQIKKVLQWCTIFAGLYRRKTIMGILIIYGHIWYITH